MKPLTIITCTAATIAALAGPAVGDMHAQRVSPTTDAQLRRIEAARLGAIEDRVASEADTVKGTPHKSC